ncbi:cyclic GMP-AMP synthase [Peromyscus leucopus]|uniref:cyclic GMP-AMP synthase n=1 Tax=Peromyscus leucopus TaxID=10041 RepID=UPI001885268A|nr:cyclic GMP-AMP synthase [Peromyscus leucopus]
MPREDRRPAATKPGKPSGRRHLALRQSAARLRPASPLIGGLELQRLRPPGGARRPDVLSLAAGYPMALVGRFCPGEIRISLDRLFLAATCDLTRVPAPALGGTDRLRSRQIVKFRFQQLRRVPLPAIFPRSRFFLSGAQSLRYGRSAPEEPSAKRATTEPKGTVAARPHVGSCVPQRGARSRRAECDGDPAEKPRAQAPRARPGRASVRTKDPQPSATGAAGDAEQPGVREPQPPTVPEVARGVREPQLPTVPEAEVSRGPRGRRGARSTGQQRAPRASRKEPETLDKKLKRVLGNLKLKRDEISEAAEVVNEVVKSLLKGMQTRESEFKGVQKLNTGSYYEHVKTGIDVSVEKEKPGSPAVTLLIRNPEEISVDIILALESKGSWPISTKEGLPIKNWLGTKVRTKLRQEPFYLVPKNAKVGNGFQGKTWRLSFSHTEKYILSNHGIEKTCCESAGVKCCRKDCLKLMKYLLEQLKKEYQELDEFCSYYVKTAIFHMWTENPQDSHWDPKQLSTCFDEFLAFFVECLRTEKLMHYFIPKFNLFSQEEVDQKSKEFLLEKIEYERNNGFPIFDKF